MSNIDRIESERWEPAAPKFSKKAKAGGEYEKPSVHGPLYTKKEAAAYLGIEVRQLELMIAEGKIRKMRRTSKALIPQSELDRFLIANVHMGYL